MPCTVSMLEKTLKSISDNGLTYGKSCEKLSERENKVYLKQSIQNYIILTLGDIRPFISISDYGTP